MIEHLPFGATGHTSSRTLFGGAAFKPTTDQATAKTVLDLLLRQGVNHIDTAHGYGQGNSEVQIGHWMADHRKDFFLATKTRERTSGGARSQLEQSLQRLQVPQVDLIQMHNLTDPAEWDIAMGRGGALEGLIAAREEGLTRFIGVTGHGPDRPAHPRTQPGAFPVRLGAAALQLPAGQGA